MRVKRGDFQDIKSMATAMCRTIVGKILQTRKRMHLSFAWTHHVGVLCVVMEPHHYL